MCDRGERRKKTFNKAKRHAKVYEMVARVSSEEFVGEVGRFKKCKHLETRTDNDKTNSNWYGKNNYKHSDKKRFAKMEEDEKDFVKYSKPNEHEFLYVWD